jgi:hypothetical protein
MIRKPPAGTAVLIALAITVTLLNAPTPAGLTPTCLRFL